MYNRKCEAAPSGLAETWPSQFGYTQGCEHQSTDSGMNARSLSLSPYVSLALSPCFQRADDEGSKYKPRIPQSVLLVCNIFRTLKNSMSSGYSHSALISIMPSHISKSLWPRNSQSWYVHNWYEYEMIHVSEDATTQDQRIWPLTQFEYHISIMPDYR